MVDRTKRFRLCGSGTKKLTATVTTKITLDLTQVVIRPFASQTVVNRFCCGKEPINRFLKNKARKMNDRSEQRIFCAHLGASTECIGYYSLQLGSDHVSEVLGTKQSYVRNHVAFAAVTLMFLGVHEPCQRQGLGEYLLMDVFTKVAEISKSAGFYALTLLSLDEQSTAFYKSLNFEAYGGTEKQPKMLYPLADILTLVNGRAASILSDPPPIERICGSG